MSLKLSIIVPVYGVEAYLPKCIDSILDQDLPAEDYEIILVDDGSPDRCGDICDEYASKYGNIRVVHRKNGGLSAARNSGIEIAQGKYIQFVDSDDYLEPNVLKALVEKMETDNLDVLRFNYQNVNGKDEVIHPDKDPKCFVDFRDEICDGLTFLNERLGPACYAIQFMIRRDLFVSQCLRFKEGIYFEDMEWTPRMVRLAKRITSTDRTLYNYLIRVGSITKSIEENKIQKKLQDRMSILEAFQKEINCISDARWYKGMTAHIVIGIIESICVKPADERKEYLKRLSDLQVFPLSSYQLNVYARRKAFLINLSPVLACSVFSVKKKNRIKK